MTFELTLCRTLATSCWKFWTVMCPFRDNPYRFSKFSAFLVLHRRLKISFTLIKFTLLHIHIKILDLKCSPKLDTYLLRHKYFIKLYRSIRLIGHAIVELKPHAGQILRSSLNGPFASGSPRHVRRRFLCTIYFNDNILLIGSFPLK